MYGLRIAAAVALLSTITATGALAQFSEPAAFEAQHPDRDVLNGGALTPAARGAAGFNSLARADDLEGSAISPSARGIHRRYRLHRPQSR